MLFLSCGFISQDSWIPFKVLAWEWVLRISLWKPLDFPHCKERIGIIEGVHLSGKHNEKLGSTRQPHISYMSQDGLYWSLNDLSVLDDISDLSKWSCCCYLFVCLRGLSLFFCRGLFSSKYKDGTICKLLPRRTLEDSTLGSLWHDFLFSLSWLCLWERRQANYISVLFRLCPDPDSQCVHLHFMKEQKPSSQEIQQEKGLPHCLRLESLEPAIGKKRRLGSKESVSLLC